MTTPTDAAIHMADPATLREHPQHYRLFSPLSGENRRLLVADVEQHGIKQALIISRRGKEPVIVDGHERWRVALELGLAAVPVVAEDFADERAEVERLVRNNINRRHLSQQERHELVVYFLANFPERSNRSIARELKVSHNTVGAAREAQERGGQIDHQPLRRGVDGVVQPAKKRSATKRGNWFKDEARQLEVAAHEQQRQELYSEFALFKPSETYGRLEQACKVILGLSHGEVVEALNSEPKGYPTPLRETLQSAGERLKEVLDAVHSDAATSARAVN